MLYYPLTFHDTFHPENQWAFWKIGVWLHYNASVSFCRTMKWIGHSVEFNSVQFSRSIVLFATPGAAACQASLPITSSRGLLRLMSIQSVMPSSHLILCRPLRLLPSIFSSIKVFPMSQFFSSGGPSIGVSASASVPPMNTQDWFPLGWTAWISLQS